ncbi:23S rRNA (adenine(2030)-N(6))-methyltransferase RlmJ [Methylobacter psychrophilus]|uniref:23S rRNA (adenine(2030)-N(6))-methyltransferase RlmJ n=1 Tax=Methylobacter psychrophilus TaxID=96941 RepID=UPI0021D4BE9D|nr:23S rRNA (adenine(2030)-N(6))-methyltransferase RlmJ [Methylobacter psychrophilus]
MLSYRHSFHAGNFADVLKHLILINILEYLGKKEKPFTCIDTHAGPGDYALDSEFALKNKEFENGITRLWQRTDLPDSVAHYVKVIKEFNNTETLSRYPGSPLIIKQFLRNKDCLFLYELHSTEIQLLTAAVNRDRRIKVFHADGLKNSVGLLPPKEHRGLVLIDPSYEIKSDYEQVVETLIQMHKRFATGTYALWYPVVDRSRNQQLEKAIKSSGLKNVQLFELGIKTDTHEHGMTASGMIVVNPPWTLAPEMQQTLPWLADTLAIEGAGKYRIETLMGE